MKANLIKKEVGNGGHTLYGTYEAETAFGTLLKTVAYHAVGVDIAVGEDREASMYAPERSGTTKLVFERPTECPESIQVPDSIAELKAGGWKPVSKLPPYRKNPMSLEEEAKDFWAKFAK
jgi:hypothetical protein